VRAKALVIEADLLLGRGDAESAEARAKEAHALAREHGLGVIASEALLSRAATLSAGSDEDGARALFENAFRAADESNAKEVLWRAGFELGRRCLRKGDLADTKRYFRRAESVLLEIIEGLPEELTESYRSLEGRAEVLRETADFSRRFQEERTVLRQIGLDEEQLAGLIEINKQLAAARGTDRLLETILRSAVDLTGAERAYIIIDMPEGPRVRLARDVDNEPVDAAGQKVSHSVISEVLKTGRPVLSTDAVGDEKFKSSKSISDLRLRSVLAVPLRAGGSLSGVIYIENRFQRGVFTERDVWLLDALSTQAAIALSNAELVAEAVHARKKAEESAAKLEQYLDEAVLEAEEVRAELESQKRSDALRADFSNITGRSPAIMKILSLIDRIAPTDTPVLILGESGTGKELIARALHTNGPRRDSPFLSINCAAFSEALLESELFGHKKGAFTGAVDSRNGLLEEAGGGTLLLDEIGEMPPAMQTKLLRFLDAGEFRPVGGRRTKRVDVRVLSATNADPRRLIADGRFREDLLYRLNVVTVKLPPLRERAGDIPLLVEAFLARKAQRASRPRMTRGAMKLLSEYPWPGNVRELENEIDRLLAIGEDPIRARSLAGRIRERRAAPELLASVVPLDEAVRAAEIREIRKALRETGGNKSQTARMLGIGRKSLHRRMEKYGLS
jgi:transcriptional regulator with GAF, ATPase, and Fis domain